MSAIAGKFGPAFLKVAQLNQPNGVAGLDGSGKILTANLPSSVTGGLNFKGSYDASGSLPTSPTNGDLYMVSVAGSGGGTFTSPGLEVGDYIFWSTSANAWEPIFNAKTTDAVNEGSVNLYHTAARAQAAAVRNDLAASTTQAPTTSAVNSALALKAGLSTRAKERYVLTGTNITNGYIVLAHLALNYSINAGVQGLGLIEQSIDSTTGDYLVSTDGGSGNTRMTFMNDLATGGLTPLAAGDVIYVQYAY